MNTKLTSSAIASAVSLALAGVAQAQKHPEKPTYKYEKCYGIARTGQNDCFTATNSCGGTSTRDGEPEAWIYLPAGTCNKIVGGVLDKTGHRGKETPKKDGEREEKKQ